MKECSSGEVQTIASSLDAELHIKRSSLLWWKYNIIGSNFICIISMVVLEAFIKHSTTVSFTIQFYCINYMAGIVPLQRIIISNIYTLHTQLCCCWSTAVHALIWQFELTSTLILCFGTKNSGTMKLNNALSWTGFVRYLTKMCARRFVWCPTKFLGLLVSLDICLFVMFAICHHVFSKVITEIIPAASGIWPWTLN